MRISPIRNYGQAKKMSFGMYTNNEAKNLAKKILTAKPDDEDYIQYKYDYIHKTIENCPFVYVSLNSPDSLKAVGDLNFFAEKKLWASIDDFKEPKICKTPKDLSLLASDIKADEEFIKNGGQQDEENHYVDESDIRAKQEERLTWLAQ